MSLCPARVMELGAAKLAFNANLLNDAVCEHLRCVAYTDGSSVFIRRMVSSDSPYQVHPSCSESIMSLHWAPHSSDSSAALIVVTSPTSRQSTSEPRTNIHAYHVSMSSDRFISSLIQRIPISPLLVPAGAGLCFYAPASAWKRVRMLLTIATTDDLRLYAFTSANSQSIDVVGILPLNSLGAEPSITALSWRPTVSDSHQLVVASAGSITILDWASSQTSFHQFTQRRMLCSLTLRTLLPLSDQTWIGTTEASVVQSGTFSVTQHSGVQSVSSISQLHKTERNNSNNHSNCVQQQTARLEDLMQASSGSLDSHISLTSPLRSILSTTQSSYSASIAASLQEQHVAEVAEVAAVQTSEPAPVDSSVDPATAASAAVNASSAQRRAARKRKRLQLLAARGLALQAAAAAVAAASNNDENLPGAEARHMRVSFSHNVIQVLDAENDDGQHRSASRPVGRTGSLTSSAASSDVDNSDALDSESEGGASSVFSSLRSSRRSTPISSQTSSPMRSVRLISTDVGNRTPTNGRRRISFGLIHPLKSEEGQNADGVGSVGSTRSGSPASVPHSPPSSASSPGMSLLHQPRVSKNISSSPASAAQSTTSAFGVHPLRPIMPRSGFDALASRTSSSGPVDVVALLAGLNMSAAPEVVETEASVAALGAAEERPVSPPPPALHSPRLSRAPSNEVPALRPDDADQLENRMTTAAETLKLRRPSIDRRSSLNSTAGTVATTSVDSIDVVVPSGQSVSLLDSLMNISSTQDLVTRMQEADKAQLIIFSTRATGAEFLHAQSCMHLRAAEHVSASRTSGEHWLIAVASSSSPFVECFRAAAARGIEPLSQFNLQQSDSQSIVRPRGISMSSFEPSDASNSHYVSVLVGSRMPSVFSGLASSLQTHILTLKLEIEQPQVSSKSHDPVSVPAVSERSAVSDSTVSTKLDLILLLLNNMNTKVDSVVQRIQDVDNRVQRLETSVTLLQLNQSS